MTSLGDILQRSIARTPEQVEAFHRHRKEAFEIAVEVYEDRAASYNIDHEPFEEMVFGPLSLASELHKRTSRMCGLLTPLRTTEFREQDLNRLVDLAIDMLNYTSWFYAQIQQALPGAGNENSDDSPDFLNRQGKGEPCAKK